MELKTGHSRKASWRRGALATSSAAVALVLAVLPATAGATLVEPHSATHVVTPLAAPASVPGPSLAPTPRPVATAPGSSAPVLNAGPGSSGGPAPRPQPVESSGAGSRQPSSQPATTCDLTCLSGRRRAAHDGWVASAFASTAEPDNIVLEREMKIAEAKYRALDAAVKDAQSRVWAREADAMAAEQAAKDARHKAREKAREERAAALAAALAVAAEEESKMLADKFAEAMGYGDDAPQAQGGGGGGDRPCLGDAPLYMRNWEVEDGGGASGEC